MPLEPGGNSETQQIQDCRRRVDQAGCSSYSQISLLNSRHCQDQRNAYVLLVQEKRMAGIAVMLPESLRVVAIQYEQGLLFQTSGPDSIPQHAERRIPVVQGVAIAVDLTAFRERARDGSRIRMVSRDRKIGYEKTLTARKRVDPGKDPLNG